VTIFYQSNGKTVGVQSQREKLGGHVVSPVDSQTVRAMVKIPYGANRPDPGTKFIAKAQVVTMLHGNNDLALGPAEEERTMTQFANVIAVNFNQGNPFLEVVVQIRKGIYNASVNGNADFGVLATVTYIATSGDVVTLTSGRVAIKTGTTF